MSDQMKGLKPNIEIQKMMESLGCTGDSVKPKDIVDRIEVIDFQTVTIAGSKFMYCGIRMLGGFVVVGKPAACIDPANWRDEIGQKVSFDNSFDEIYKLEAYRKMSTPKAPPREFPVRKGFKLFDAKPIQREAYQLTMQDVISMRFDRDDVSDSNRAGIIVGCTPISFAYHCKPEEIKAGDYVVFINENDTYHCSEEVFNERNIT